MSAAAQLHPPTASRLHREALEADEERRLALRFRDQADAPALRRLVEGNMPVVERVAARYRGLAPIADLVQEGNIGLIEAARRFDPEHGTLLSTFAVWWIRASILRFLERNRGAVRVTTTKARSRIYYQMSLAQRRLMAAGEEPTAQRIAETLAVRTADVEVMMQAARPDVALDARIGSDGEDRAPLVERMAGNVDAPDARLEADELAAVLRHKVEVYVRGLKGRARELARARLLTEDPPSLRELGERWGLTSEAARRLESRVLGPLRRSLVRELGDAVPTQLGRRAFRRPLSAFA